MTPCNSINLLVIAPLVTLSFDLHLISTLTTFDYDPDFVTSESQPLKGFDRIALSCLHCPVTKLMRLEGLCYVCWNTHSRLIVCSKEN